MAEMTDEKFFAWLDGELTDAEASEVARAVAADPELQARAAAHRAVADRLRGAFAPIAEAPVPPGIQAPLRSEPNVATLAEARARRDARRAPPLWQQAAAMAATLALGIVTGAMLVPDQGSPIAPEAGRLVAAASLEDALYSQLASVPAQDGPRIGLTFRDASGKMCRSFTDQAASGLACLENGDWRIRGLVQAPDGQSSEYRMAAGVDPNLAAMIDSTIAGEPLDAKAEREAMLRGWR